VATPHVVEMGQKSFMKICDEIPRVVEVGQKYRALDSLNTFYCCWRQFRHKLMFV
jgi:hypothetical protein